MVATSIRSRLFHIVLTTSASLFITSTACSAIVDFEDLAVGTSYSNQIANTTLTTGGVTFDLLKLNISIGTPGPAGTISVVDSGGLGAGKGMNMQSMVLGFRSPPLPTSEISFLYFDGTLKKNIKINGDERVFSNDLFSLSGQTIGGATITVTDNAGTFVAPTAYGTFTVTGAINSFSFGGDDLVINDITIGQVVPEPAGLVLASLGAIVLSGRRSR